MTDEVFDESGFGALSASTAEFAEALRSALATRPADKAIPIGLVGAGWIGGMQLQAYRDAGFHVSAILDRHPERAAELAAATYPDATVYDDLDRFLSHPGLVVVDVATHVEGRHALIEAALERGRHVLSQKPFVEDLGVGRALGALARSRDRQLAVNQNGRWAPHFASALALVRAGLIGDVVSADFSVAWPHDLIVSDKPAFASMPDLVLFDFGAHWFDLLAVLAPDGPLSVSAWSSSRPSQAIEAPVQAQSVVIGDGFTGTLVFRAGERFRESGAYRISGTRGVIEHRGTSLGGRTVSIETESGAAELRISPDWFRYGLAGSMRALLGTLTDGRPLEHGWDSALRGLAVCFAALESARVGTPVSEGTIARRGQR